MACGCRKGRTAAATAGSDTDAVERGSRRSRMMFFVVVDGQEQAFTGLREARLLADELGLTVEARRTAV